MKCEELGSGEVFSRVMFHIANAWDDGSKITLLGVALEKVSFWPNFTLKMFHA